MCEVCSKLTTKTPERRQQRRSDVFIVNFEHISHLAVVFLLYTLNMQLPIGKKTIDNIGIDIDIAVAEKNE